MEWMLKEIEPFIKLGVWQPTQWELNFRGKYASKSYNMSSAQRSSKAEWFELKSSKFMNE